MANNRPTREEEAQHYWYVMQESYSVTLTEYRAELAMIGHHCQSEVLKDVCEKNAKRFDRRPVFQRVQIA